MRIHYDVVEDAFLFPCIKALSVGTISSNNGEQGFIKTGFTKWKRALEKKVLESTYQ